MALCAAILGRDEHTSELDNSLLLSETSVGSLWRSLMLVLQLWVTSVSLLHGESPEKAESRSHTRYLKRAFTRLRYQLFLSLKLF